LWTLYKIGGIQMPEDEYDEEESDDDSDYEDDE
jgi:hypothetical protein